DLDKHKIESVLGQISNPQNPRLDLFVDVLTNLTNTEFKMLNDTSFMKTSSVIQIMKGCLNKCLHCVFKASSFNIEDMPYPMILKIVEKMIPPNNKKIKLFIYNDKELTVMVAAFCPGEPVALKYILPYKTFCLPAKDSGESKVFDGGILKKDSESDKNNSENIFLSWHEIIQLLEHRKYFVERKNVKRYAAFSDCHGDYLGLMKNLLEKGVVAEFIGKEVGVFREDCICIDGVYYYYVDKDMLVVCVGDYAGLLGDSIQLFNLLIWLEINHEAIILVGNHDDGQGKIHNKNGWSEINENDKDIDALFFADFGFSTEEAGKFSRALKDKDLVSLSKVLSENRIMKEKILWAVTRPAVARISLINGPRNLFLHGGFERDTLEYIISERIGEEEFLTTLERLLQEDRKFKGNEDKPHSLIYRILSVNNRDWVFDHELIFDICMQTDVDFLVVGHKSTLGYKPRDKIQMVGAAVELENKGIQQRVIALDTGAFFSKKITTNRGIFVAEGYQAINFYTERGKEFMNLNDFDEDLVRSLFYVLSEGEWDYCNSRVVNFVENSCAEAIQYYKLFDNIGKSFTTSHYNNYIYWFIDNGESRFASYRKDFFGKGKGLVVVGFIHIACNGIIERKIIGAYFVNEEEFCEIIKKKIWRKLEVPEKDELVKGKMFIDKIIKQLSSDEPFHDGGGVIQDALNIYRENLKFTYIYWLSKSGKNKGSPIRINNNFIPALFVLPSLSLNSFLSLDTITAIVNNNIEFLIESFFWGMILIVFLWCACMNLEIQNSHSEKEFIIYPLFFPNNENTDGGKELKANIEEVTIEFNQDISMPLKIKEKIISVCSWQELPDAASGERSAVIKLKKPVSVRINGKKGIIRYIKIKGLGNFSSMNDPVKPLLEVYKTSADFHLFVDEEGNSVIIDPEVTIVNGLLIERAKIEYEILKDVNGKMKENVNIPIGYGCFNNIVFEGKHAGFVIMGINDESDVRIGDLFETKLELLNEGFLYLNDEISKALGIRHRNKLVKFDKDKLDKFLTKLFMEWGKTLRRFHDKGFIHRRVHDGNYSYKNGKLFIHDLDAAVKKRDLNDIQIFYYQLGDLALLTSHGIYDIYYKSWLPFIKKDADCYSLILKGYFGKDYIKYEDDIKSLAEELSSIGFPRNQEEWIRNTFIIMLQTMNYMFIPLKNILVKQGIEVPDTEEGFGKKLDVFAKKVITFNGREPEAKIGKNNNGIVSKVKGTISGLFKKRDKEHSVGVYDNSEFQKDGGRMTFSSDILTYYQSKLDDLKKAIQKDIGRDVNISIKDLIAPVFDKKKFMKETVIRETYFQGKEAFLSKKVKDVYRSIINDAPEGIKVQIIRVFNQRIDEFGWKPAIDEYIRLNYSHLGYTGMEEIVDVVDHSIGWGVYKYIVKPKGSLSEDDTIEFFIKNGSSENDYLKNEFVWFELQRLILGINIGLSPHIYTLENGTELLIMPVIPGNSANVLITALIKEKKYKELKGLILNYMIYQMALGDVFGRNDRHLANTHIKMIEDKINLVMTFDNSYFLNEQNYDWTEEDISQGIHECNMTILLPEFYDSDSRLLLFEEIEKKYKEIWQKVIENRSYIDKLIWDVYGDFAQDKITILNKEMNAGPKKVLERHYRSLFYGYMYRRVYRKHLTALLNGYFIKGEDANYKKYCYPEENNDFTASRYMECFRGVLQKDIRTKNLIGKYGLENRENTYDLYNKIRSLIMNYSGSDGESKRRLLYADLDEVRNI
ncbi:MAG: hypothetical protein KAJ14_14815, partial [Candidatus Omnitrophica bacterium]|nr:hypothetical protein [Candidatus Omnitrophota bacterium]